MRFQPPADQETMCAGTIVTMVRRSGQLDDPAYDDLFATAARLHQAIFIHPQIPSNELRDAAYPAWIRCWTSAWRRSAGAGTWVSDYITTNIYVTSSGMLQERLLRHTLDLTGADRVLSSTDYPFHQPGAAAVGQFFDAIPDPTDRSKIASGNAEALFHLT